MEIWEGKMVVHRMGNSSVGLVCWRGLMGLLLRISNIIK